MIFYVKDLGHISHKAFNSIIPIISTPSPRSKSIEFIIELEMELLLWFISVGTLHSEGAGSKWLCRSSKRKFNF